MLESRQTDNYLYFEFVDSNIVSGTLQILTTIDADPDLQRLLDILKQQHGVIRTEDEI